MSMSKNLMYAENILLLTYYTFNIYLKYNFQDASLRVPILLSNYPNYIIVLNKLLYFRDLGLWVYCGYNFINVTLRSAGLHIWGVV